MTLTRAARALIARLRSFVPSVRRRHVLGSAERLRSLIALAPDGIFLADLTGRYTDVNEAGCKLLRCTREDIVGNTILDFIPPDQVERLLRSREEMLKGGTNVAEWSLRRKDGSFVPVEVSARILSDGRWQGFVRDISERKVAEVELRLAANVFNATLEAILVTDAKRRVITVNRAYTKMTGYERDEVLGKNPKLLASGRHDDAFYREMWGTLESTDQWQGEVWNRRKNGELFPAWENISVVRDHEGRVVHFVSVMSDISAIKNGEKALNHLAHHDALTGVANRTVFKSNLPHTLERAKRHKQRVALLYVDLDRFKVVNDTLGHSAGDELLQTIAGRLMRGVRSEDLIARLGGDEFVVVLEEIADADAAAAIARKLLACVAEPVVLQDGEVSTTASIGISIFPDDADNAVDLTRAADAAMYRAKNCGRNSIEFAASGLTTRVKERVALEAALQQAISRNQLVVFYQPQIDVQTGHIMGVEAQLRWQHPERGTLLPADFIGIAEESSLIDAIGSWLVRRVFLQARAWRRARLPALRLSINISGRQVVYDHIAETLRDAMERAGLRLGELSIELEITEKVLLSGEPVANALRRLRELGCRIAIDDFGTGYSSLLQLKRLGVDTLRIDRAFLRDVPNDPEHNAITAAIIAVAHSLGMEVTAEGLETMEQLQFLRQQRCDSAQGFLISDAVPADEIERLVRKPPLAVEGAAASNTEAKSAAMTVPVPTESNSRP
ncbi:MAG: EAL domain-containing protein [Gemmatimonadota bacterium]